MQNRNLVSISDLTKDEILALLRRAKEFEKNPNQHILDGKVVGSLFFEPSTTLIPRGIIISLRVGMVVMTRILYLIFCVVMFH